MNLPCLLSLIDEMPAYRQLMEELRRRGRHQLAVLDAAKPYLVAASHQELRLPFLVVTAQPEGSRKLYDQLLAWCGNRSQVQLFPEPDALPYERLSSDSVTVQERLRSLWALTQKPEKVASPPLIVASASAVARKTTPQARFTAACHQVRKGLHVDPRQLMARWQGMGYERENATEAPGTVSRRGGIIDIYPTASELPARIEFFGNQIESLRLFDPASQRSLEPIPSIAIVPATEVLIPDFQGSKLQEIQDSLGLAQCSPEAREWIEGEMTMLLQGQWFPGLEFYAPLFNAGTILDYLPPDALLVLDEPAEVQATIEELDSQARGWRRDQTQRGELPPNFPVPYLTWPQFKARLEEMEKRLLLSRWRAEGDKLSHSMAFAPAPSYGGRLPAFLKEARQRLRERQRVIVVSQQAARLSELLGEEDIIAPPQATIEQPPPPGSLALLQGSLAEGWVMEGGATAPGSGGKLAVFTDVEVFGFIKQRRQVRKHAVRRQAFLSELIVGDYVVHIDHGIARFAGMVTMSLDGGEREYLALEYGAGDKLYVPSDQVDRVSSYIGPRGQPPALSRLGTQEWARAKQRVKRSAGAIAQELLALYAAREVIPGFAYSPDSIWQQEMEASFPYIETPDQLEAVREAKADMESPKPMDRLVCGDVGYGKTEVAIRAAFKAVMDGRQVAVLVPTTILAQQHFASFSQRLGAFPLRVEVLSRFRSEGEQRAVIEGLASGSVDICIGTHRLLQKDIAFKNLGLVIIDEEQRFGVAHKERLKQMRREVDVLTLSATPIPRTLHISLAGVRDMSTMETPPEERLAIETYVAEYDERLVRGAIIRELERGGQVFFVHNRVQTISRLAQGLAALVPEAVVAIAHGQMAEEELESTMFAFSQGKIDVLASTTIIESGLDMPNVNTIIVNECDKLGLTQLYQLRGRVGRGSNRAYAYFLYKRGKQLTPSAQKRLKTISQATELGAGFRIAMKDLEIRGAGNLLGTEQSGHVGAVGFDLYCRLLGEAVAELRDSPAPAPRPPAPTIELPLPAYIPEHYISDVSTRLALYQRLTKVESAEEATDMAQELGDRFGEPPLPAKNLLYIVKIKAIAAAGGVRSISTKDGQAILKLEDKIPENSYGDGVKIGHSQLRLDLKRLGEGWPSALEEVLKRLASPKEDSPL